MPGEVIQGHAKYENECSRCHQPLGKASQRTLCLECHKDVASDIKMTHGYHGLSDSVKGVDCKRCHPEHKGRKAIVVRLDPETFSHKITDFELKGGHLKVSCVGCHASKARYRDAPSACVGCHKDNDPHRGRLGKDCAKCHGEGTWREAGFDHGKTDFALKGKHQKVACRLCHANDRFKGTPSDCFACHRQEDAHAGRYGRRCGECHSPENWKRSLLDHDRTRFPLKGAHRRAKCDGCHTGKVYEQKLGMDCAACHKHDDEHKGRYGTKCETCHVSESWKRASFRHGKDIEPLLRGKHEKLGCSACHKGRIDSEKPRKACLDCHRQNDAHRGQEGKVCERCHNQRGWRTDVFFDHGLTRFPLIGLHAVASCEACHVSAAYKNSPLECAGCHKARDVHERSLGPKCGLCHNPNGWGLWRFDHDSQTKFVLEGAHSGLACRSCHRGPADQKMRLSKTCFGCHEADDVHRGGFGRPCERCHGTKSFQEIKPWH